MNELDKAIKWANEFSCCYCKNYNHQFGVCKIEQDCHEMLETLVEAITNQK